MKLISIYLITGIGILTLTLTCCNSHYPEEMSRVERKKYYSEYNKAFIKATAPSTEATADTLYTAPGREASRAVPFSIRNNSVMPQKLEINGNILVFNPLEVRYVGFQVNTKVYLYNKHASSGRGKYLFEVKAGDGDKRYKIFN